MDKREFLKSVGSAGLLTILGVSAPSCNDEDEPAPDNANFTVDLTQPAFSALQNDGGWVLHPDRDYLLVNVGGTIRAFSSRCTHQGCTRNWAFSANATCNCHASVFNSSGSVVSGPASQSLTSVSVTREGDVLTVG